MQAASTHWPSPDKATPRWHIILEPHDTRCFPKSWRWVKVTCDGLVKVIRTNLPQPNIKMLQWAINTSSEYLVVGNKHTGDAVLSIQLVCETEHLKSDVPLHMIGALPTKWSLAHLEASKGLESIVGPWSTVPNMNKCVIASGDNNLIICPIRQLCNRKQGIMSRNGWLQDVQYQWYLHHSQLGQFKGWQPSPYWWEILRTILKGFPAINRRDAKLA